MAVVSSKEISGGRRGHLDQTFQRTFSRVWQVITDGAYDDALSVMFADGIPALGDTYLISQTGLADVYAEVVSYDTIQPDADCPNLWHVQVNYSTEPKKDPALASQAGTGGGAPGEGGQGETPDLLPPQVRIVTQFKQVPFEVTTEDAFDENIVLGTNEILIEGEVANSAHEKFLNVPMTERTYQVIQIRRAVRYFDRLGVRDFVNCVNRYPWRGYGARTVWLAKFDGEQAYERRTSFWWVDYELHVDPKGWDFKAIDQGAKYVDGGFSLGATNKFTDFVSNTNNPTYGYLNGQGDKHIPTAAIPYYTLYFKRKFEFDFTELNLPPF